VTDAEQPAPHPSELPTTYPWRPEWERSPCDIERALLQDDPPLLLDCRVSEERALADIPGSIHIPLGELESRLDELSDAASGATGTIIVYCHHGVRSIRAVAVLRAAGYTDCWSLAGGIHAWSASIDKSIPVY